MIGRFVKARRKQLGWTQKETSDKSGLSERQLQRIESGDCSETMEKSFRLWALLTGCDYDDDETTG